MDLNRKKFNESIAKSFVGTEEFDNYFIHYAKFNTTDYFDVINLLSKVNNVSFGIYKRESNDDGYIAYIKQNENEVKSTLYYNKNTDMSSWFAKELLYFFRDQHNTNKLNKNI